MTEWEWFINGHGKPALRAAFDDVGLWLVDGVGDDDDWKGRWVLEGGTNSDDNRFEWRFHVLEDAMRAAPFVAQKLNELHSLIDAWGGEQ